MAWTSEMAARLLRTRWLVRAPIVLHRAGLGWVLGSRFLVLEHRGRKSGLPRLVVLEVIGHPSPLRFVVVSGLGRSAQWFRNISADPQVRVSVGRRRDREATATPLPPQEAQAALAAYRQAHPEAAARLTQILEELVDGPVVPGESLPVVALDLQH